MSEDAEAIEDEYSYYSEEDADHMSDISPDGDELEMGISVVTQHGSDTGPTETSEKADGWIVSINAIPGVDNAVVLDHDDRRVPAPDGRGGSFNGIVVGQRGKLAIG